MGQNITGNILILPVLPFRRPDFWDLFLITFTMLILAGMLFPLSLGLSVPIMGFIFFIAYGLIYKTIPPTPKSLAMWLLLLLALMGLSQLWTVWSEDSFRRVIKVTSIMAPSFLLAMVVTQCPPDKINAHKNWIFGILCVPLFLIAVRLHFPQLFLPVVDPSTIAQFMDRSNFNKHMGFIAMVLPSLVALSTHKNYKQKTYFLLGLIPLFIITQSQASQLAIIIMAAVGFGLLPFLSSFTRKMVGGVFIALALFMPFLSAIAFDLVEKLPLYETFIPSTGLMRLENWDFITREILKSPWVGFGIDSARHMTFTTDKIFHPADQLLHPHNGFLQMWIDFGVLGAIVMASGIGIYISRHTNVIHFTTFVGTIIILLLSWSIWSSWLIGGLFAVHALIILASKSRSDQLTS